MSESTSPPADATDPAAESATRSQPSASFPSTPSLMAGITNRFRQSTLQVDTEEPTIAVPPQQPTTPGGTIIVCPIMGGLQDQGTRVVAWTGGKPRIDWSRLERPTSKAFTPKCLRDTYAKAAINFDGRRAGLYPLDSKLKFKSGDDIDKLCRFMFKEFKNWGMDTITYRPDPSDSTRMISVLHEYPHLNLENMSNHADIQVLFDEYDEENDTAAKEYLLNSLDLDLQDRIDQRMNEDSSFVDIFLIFLDIELPSYPL